MSRPSRSRIAVALAVIAVIGGTIALTHHFFFRPNRLTAYFTTATAIYPGDEVRVSGVKVGKIKSISSEGTRVRMELDVDRGVPVPADAKAVIVAQNLVAARYVQLTPAYKTTGPKMSDGAVIPVERTATPVEWDEVKTQLTRLATDLGPNSKISTPSIARFIDSAANALDGNGAKLRQALAQLSGVGRTLAGSSTNIVDIIKNLQKFVTALRDSNVQLVEFNNRLATLSSVVDDSKSDLDAALTNLSSAVVEVQRFIAGTRDQTSEQVSRLADVTQVLVDKHMALENILHVAPNALANFYNDYDPNTGAIVGGFGLMDFQNPTMYGVYLPPLVPGCGATQSIENVTATESGKLCALFLGPGLRTLNFNEFPVPLNPILKPAPFPGRVVYSEPRLAPGGEGPKPGVPDMPPAVSAYTGLPGDPQPNGPAPSVPLGRIPGAAMPEPPPPTEPAAPPAPSLPGVLLPAEAPHP